MRAVLQKVSKADVTIENKISGIIKTGLVVLLGIGKEDSESDADYLTKKIVNLRIFEDEDQKMNLSLTEFHRPTFCWFIKFKLKRKFRCDKYET